FDCRCDSARSSLRRLASLSAPSRSRHVQFPLPETYQAPGSMEATTLRPWRTTPPDPRTYDDFVAAFHEDIAWRAAAVSAAISHKQSRRAGKLLPLCRRHARKALAATSTERSALGFRRQTRG